MTAPMLRSTSSPRPSSTGPPCAVGTPQDAAPAVLFRVSPPPRYVTGQTIPVDGGFSVQGRPPVPVSASPTCEIRGSPRSSAWPWSTASTSRRNFPTCGPDRRRRRTGLHHFGPDDFRARRRLWLEEVDGDPERNGLGRLTLFRDCVRYAVNCLRIRDLLARYPEIPDVAISAPIIVVGLPRSGTTHLVTSSPPRAAAFASAVGELRTGS